MFVYETADYTYDGKTFIIKRYTYAKGGSFMRSINSVYLLLHEKDNTHHNPDKINTHH